MDYKQVVAVITANYVTGTGQMRYAICKANNNKIGYTDQIIHEFITKQKARHHI
jgi:urocanate hydratase